MGGWKAGRRRSIILSLIFGFILLCRGWAILGIAIADQGVRRLRERTFFISARPASLGSPLLTGRVPVLRKLQYY